MEITTGTGNSDKGTATHKPIVIGINGSPNVKGLCANLLEKSLAEAESYGTRPKMVHLSEKLKTFFTGGVSKEPEPDFVDLANDLYQAEGMIIITPVYWNNMSSLTKAFIEKLTALEQRNYGLEGTVLGCIATQAMDGGWKVTQDVVGAMSHMGTMVPTYGTTFYNRNLAGKRKFEWMDKDVKLVGKNVAIMTRMVDQTNPIWAYRGDFRKQGIAYEPKTFSAAKAIKRRKH